MQKIVITTSDNDFDAIGLFVKNLDVKDSIVLLLTVAMSLVDGSANVTFNEGPPLTEDEEGDILSALTEGGSGRGN